MSKSHVPRAGANQDPPTPASFGLIGESAAFEAALKQVALYAPLKRNALLTGESGTGKTQIAAWMHAMSGRDGALVVVNCNGLVESLAESTLFGHRSGAFTGATGSRKGMVLRADGGTLFLDEVGDLSLAVQGKLLQWLQDGTMLPVGSDQTVQSNARVIAATNHDLADLVARRLFRFDLLMRLSQVCVFVPPLRERGQDMVLIARHALHRYAQQDGLEEATLSPRAERWLHAQPWPGNVRELDHLMGLASAHGPGTTLKPDLLARLLRDLHRHLPPALVEPARAAEAPPAPPAPAPKETAATAPEPEECPAVRLARQLGAVAPRHLIALGMSESTAGRRLRALCEAGVLKHNGAFGKAALYRLV